MNMFKTVNNGPERLQKGSKLMQKYDSLERRYYQIKFISFFSIYSSPDLSDAEKRLRSFRFYDRWYCRLFFISVSTRDTLIISKRQTNCTNCNYFRAGNGAIFKEEMLHTLRVLGDIPPDSGKVKFFTKCIGG